MTMDLFTATGPAGRAAKQLVDNETKILKM
jgi:hypothetical protein